MLGQVDDWLAELFAPNSIDTTLDQLNKRPCRTPPPSPAPKRPAHGSPSTPSQPVLGSLRAGGDPAVVGPWIAETQAKKVTAQAEIRTATGRRHMSRDEIAAVVTAFGEFAQVVQGADPADKRHIRPAQANTDLPTRGATSGSSH